MSIFKKKSPEELAKDLQKLRAKRLKLEGRANLLEKRHEEKQRIHKAKMKIHNRELEKLHSFENKLRKAFLLTGKGAKKLEEFMKEDHL